MKKLLLLQTVLMLSSFLLSFATAQRTDYRERAYAHIEATYGFGKESIGELIVKDQYRSSHNQAEHVYLAQAYQGIEIYGTSISLTFLPNGKVYNVGHHLTPADQMVISKKPVRTEAVEAIQTAASALGISSRSTTSLKAYNNKGVALYHKADISLQDMATELVYMPVTNGEYKLAWKIVIESSKNKRLYQTYVDAITGDFITYDYLTLECSFDAGYLAHDPSCHDDHHASVSASPAAPPHFSGMMAGQYNVLPVGFESPAHGNFQLVTNAENPTASPFGWHDTNGAAGPEYTFTRGNNVHAFLDRDYDDSPDMNVEGGANLIFNFPFDSEGEPSDNTDVSVTNLFYWNNIMHDFCFAYGLDELSGSFQERNYSGLGSGGDYVNAQAQYGADDPTQCGIETGVGSACINNAFFNPSADGQNGRMVMYTWNQDNSSKYLDVLEPTDLGGKIQTGLANFGPDITSEGITAEVVVVDDGTPDGSQACFPINGQPELAGKIAIIDRGGCDFSLKVYHAQEAGAVGAIICNFENIVIGMDGQDNAEDVIIPSVFISSVECNRIRLSAGSGLVVSLIAPVTTGALYRDGSVDNSIVAHEYVHGVSNRLTGGPSVIGCLSPNAQHLNEEAHGMGEGWSDFFALVTTARPGDTGSKRRGIGTYAQHEETNGKGVRDYPYSTDMSVNPLTYNNIQTQTGEHGTGAVWCAMLWEMYWTLTDTYGFDPDVINGTGGNNLAIQLVMDGMKIQPCNPGFIQARDAILTADMINNNGANQCLIWSAFAKRGLGFNALGGDPDLRADGDEGFDLPISCRSDLIITKSMTPEVVAGQDIEVTIHVTNYKDEILTNVLIEDPIPQGCIYLAGSANIEPVSGNSLVWSIPALDPDEELTLTYLLKTDYTKNSIRLAYDDIEGDPYERWDITFGAGAITNIWTPETDLVNSGEQSWKVENIAVESEQFMVPYEPYTITGNYPVYRFYHFYNTETGVDGGFLQITTDNGETWNSLEQNIFKRKYPRKLSYNTFVIPNLYAYTGLSSDFPEMTASYIDLRDYMNEEVKIRYRFGTNNANAGDGWYVDDVELMDAVIYNSEVCITSDQSDPICAEAPERGTIIDTQISIGTSEADRSSFFTIMPNPANDLIQVALTSDKTEQAVVSVYNLTGNLLSTNEWGLTTGINQKTLNIAAYPSGMYLLQVKTINGMRSEKFVIE